LKVQKEKKMTKDCKQNLISSTLIALISTGINLIADLLRNSVDSFLYYLILTVAVFAVVAAAFHLINKKK